jgi:hypothetical protein
MNRDGLILFSRLKDGTNLLLISDFNIIFQTFRGVHSFLLRLSFSNDISISRLTRTYLFFFTSCLLTTLPIYSRYLYRTSSIVYQTKAAIYYAQLLHLPA